MPKNVFTVCNVFKKNFDHENMKKTASKVTEPAQIQPKSQFLFHKNIPPRDFSIMTLVVLVVDLGTKCVQTFSEGALF